MDHVVEESTDCARVGHLLLSGMLLGVCSCVVGGPWCNDAARVRGGCGRRGRLGVEHIRRGNERVRLRPAFARAACGRGLRIARDKDRNIAAIHPEQ